LRFLRRRRGISTVLGALYFIVIALMAFSLVMWEVGQYDAYQQLVNRMNQFDIDRMTENLVFRYPGVEVLASTPPYKFDIIVCNMGGIDINTTRIYIYDQTAGSMIILDKNSPTDFYSNGFVKAGASGHEIHAQSSYNVDERTGHIYWIKIVTERGRTFSTPYPLPRTIQGPGGAGSFIDVGPIRILFEYRAINYTSLTQQTPASGWSVPKNTPLFFYIILINVGTEEVYLKKESILTFMSYTRTGTGSKTTFFVLDSLATYPDNSKFNLGFTYDEVNKPYVLKPNLSDPYTGGPPVIVKFGAGNLSPDDHSVKFDNTVDQYLCFIGLAYRYKGYIFGQTIPFVAIRVT